MPVITTLAEDLKPVIQAIPQQMQTQAALNEQLAMLINAAIRLGAYDAADFLQRQLNHERPKI